eukprot:s169_g6.t1
MNRNLMLPRPGVADIAGMGDAWESVQEVRQLLLTTGSIFKCKSDGRPVLLNVAGAALNVPTLKPLLQRLADDQGNDFGDEPCSATEMEESSDQASDDGSSRFPDGSDGGSGSASGVPTGGSLEGRMVAISDDEDDVGSMDPTLDFIPEEPDSQPDLGEPCIAFDSMEALVDEPSSSSNPLDSQPVPDDEMAPPASELSESECEYDKYRPEDKAIPLVRVPKSPPKKCENKEEEIKKLVALVANLKKERTALTLSRIKLERIARQGSRDLRRGNQFSVVSIPDESLPYGTADMDTLPMPEMEMDILGVFNDEVPPVGENDEIAENNVVLRRDQLALKRGTAEDEGGDHETEKGDGKAPAGKAKAKAKAKGKAKGKAKASAKSKGKAHDTPLADPNPASQDEGEPKTKRAKRAASKGGNKKSPEPEVSPVAARMEADHPVAEQQPLPDQPAAPVEADPPLAEKPDETTSTPHVVKPSASKTRTRRDSSSSRSSKVANPPSEKGTGVSKRQKKEKVSSAEGGEPAPGGGPGDAAPAPKKEAKSFARRPRPKSMPAAIAKWDAIRGAFNELIRPDAYTFVELFCGEGWCSRCVLLLHTICAMGGCWVLEQSRSSMFGWMPRMREFCRKQDKASEEELAAAKAAAPKTAKPKKTACKAVPKPKVSKTTEPLTDTPMKDGKRCKKVVEEDPPEDTPESVPVVAKRHRLKTTDPDAEGQIRLLKEANAKMLAELEALKKSKADKEKPGSSTSTPGSSSATPPATRRAPTPASKQKAVPRKEPEPETGDGDGEDGSDAGSGDNQELSEAAKRNRLRRLNDKYNKKLRKYYVEYEEGDTSGEDDIEREIRTESVFSTFPAVAVAMGQILIPMTQRQPRQTSLTRRFRSIKALEDAIDILSQQFEACEAVKAPATHLLELARAEVEVNSRPSRGIREFAEVSLKHAEEGCHRIFQKYGFSAPIEIEYAHLGDAPRERLPWMKFSSWAKYLLDTTADVRGKITGINEACPRGILGQVPWPLPPA